MIARRRWSPWFGSSLAVHVGDPSGRTSLERALALAPDLATATRATELMARAEALGLVWGVSDGN